MLTFRDITLKDKDVFNKFCLCRQGFGSEVTFANFYIWRRNWGIKIADDDKAVYIMGKNGGAFFFAPFADCDDFSAALDNIIIYTEANSLPLEFRCVTDELCEHLKLLYPGRFVFIEDRDSFDYVYRTQELIDLSGGKYHAKHNHVNTFKANYTWEYRPLDKTNYEQAKLINKNWLAAKGEASQAMLLEDLALADALENMDTLGLFGGSIYVDGEMTAFTIAEPARKDMAIIHFEKADVNIRGLYAAINQVFAAERLAGYEYVNRQEDMGLDGLRKAKLSYHPAILSAKFTVREMI